MPSFVWLLSLIVSGRCIQVALLLLSHIPFQVPPFIHSVDGHLSCYRFGAVVINATMNVFITCLLVDICNTFSLIFSWDWNCWVIGCTPTRSIWEICSYISFLMPLTKLVYFGKPRCHLFYNINPVTFGKAKKKKKTTN